MKNAVLRIGRIPFANLFPLYDYFDRVCRHKAYAFKTGVPSELNRLLRAGRLDISPSSSIEYLRNRDRYRILPWFSVSSSGPVGSILLFSRHPLKGLKGKTIATTHASETSVVLLRIILNDFYSLKCRFRKVKDDSSERILSSLDAVLLIGDAAMREGRHPGARYVYDLGELWFRHTGLPFVFALWIVRKNVLSRKKDLIREFSMDLMKANRHASRNARVIAGRAPQKDWLSRQELLNYWKVISYRFDAGHLKGLELFERYAFKRRT